MMPNSISRSSRCRTFTLSLPLLLGTTRLLLDTLLPPQLDTLLLLLLLLDTTLLPPLLDINTRENPCNDTSYIYAQCSNRDYVYLLITIFFDD